jgi:hypothetical protein
MFEIVELPPRRFRQHVIHVSIYAYVYYPRVNLAYIWLHYTCKYGTHMSYTQIFVVSWLTSGPHHPYQTRGSHPLSHLTHGSHPPSPPDNRVPPTAPTWHKGSTHQANRDPHVIQSDFVTSYWHLGPTVYPHRPDKRDRPTPDKWDHPIDLTEGPPGRNSLQNEKRPWGIEPTTSWPGALPYHQATIKLVITPHVILVLNRRSRLVGPRTLWTIVGPLWTALGEVFFSFFVFSISFKIWTHRIWRRFMTRPNKFKQNL